MDRTRQEAPQRFLFIDSREKETTGTETGQQMPEVRETSVLEGQPIGTGERRVLRFDGVAAASLFTGDPERCTRHGEPNRTLVTLP